MSCGRLSTPSRKFRHGDQTAHHGTSVTSMQQWVSHGRPQDIGHTMHVEGRVELSPTTHTAAMGKGDAESAQGENGNPKKKSNVCAVC